MSTAANPFRQATRAELKARVAIDGPSGAGKTWTSLEWATVLADGQPIAVVDTERGSSALYSDRFTFDQLDWQPPYDPTALAQTIRDVPGWGYAVLVIDSMSHFWEGEGGTLDIADRAGQRSGGNSFAGWKDATPKLRHLIDTIVGAPIHVIATMRSKMEYVLEEDSRGKKVPRKVGMAPVMRQGVEYEFTLVGDVDLEHRMVFTKSRCSELADQVVQPGRAREAAETFAAWLSAGEKLADPAQVAGLKADLNAASGAARRAFKEVFGHPDRLAASRVGEAVEWVAVHAQPEPEPEPEPEPLDDSPAPDADAGDVDAPPAQVEELPIDGDDHARLVRKMHALAAKAWPGRSNDAKAEREAMRKHLLGVWGVESSSDLTVDDLDDLCGQLEDIAEGRARLRLVAGPDGLDGPGVWQVEYVDEGAA